MKKLLVVVLVLAAGAYVYLISLGIHRNVAVENGEQGGMLLVGNHHVGPYYTIGNVFEELQTFNPSGEFVGVFFDDPEVVPDDSCRSFAGWIVPSTAAGLELMGQHQHLRLLPIERRQSVYCDWEGGNMLGMLIGTFKAYPALGLAAEAQGWTGETVIAYEHYHEGQTRFVMQY